MNAEPIHDNVEPLSPAQKEQLVRNGERLLLVHRAAVYRPTVITWQRVAAALVARAHQTLHSVLKLEDAQADGAALTRVLYDHVVMLAWMTADPSSHLPMIARTNRDSIQRLAKRLTKFGVNLDVDQLARDQDEVAGRRAPTLDKQAEVAQTYWAQRVPYWDFAFARSYANLFGPCCQYVHPSLLGLVPFVDVKGAPVLDAVDIQMGALGATAVNSFADALVISAVVLGAPRFEDVLHAFTNQMVD